ncbi:MAG: ABC transporter permease [Thermomicrobiales bacterium]|nr:ABC transporter permease [Thermomicrobiales bacterium]
MLNYLLRRMFLLLPVIVGISILTFTLIRLIPGDPVAIMLQDQPHTAEDLSRIRTQWGLDEPLLVQYGRYVRQLVTGDFGRSFMLQQPVLSVILDQLPATIELAVVSLVISLLIALPVGVVSAVRQYSRFDRIGTVIATLGISMPGFWIGLMLIVVFSVKLGWLPASGRIDYVAGLEPITGFYLLDSLLTGNLSALTSTLKHLIMPAMVLGSAMAALTMRMVRSSMLEVAKQDYVVSARAKGLKERAVIVHMLRNALIPTITVLGMQISGLLGGAIVIETIFAWPGTGRLTVQAISSRDYFLLQGIVFFFAITTVFFNLITDIVYGLVDPRIRYS